MISKIIKEPIEDESLTLEKLKKADEFLNANEKAGDDYIGPGPDSYFLDNLECRFVVERKDKCSYFYSVDVLVDDGKSDTLTTLFEASQRFTHIDMNGLRIFLYEVDKQYRARMKEIKSEKQEN